MNSITFLSPRRTIWRLLWSLHILAFSSLLVLAVIGHLPESSAGWVSSPPVVYTNQIRSRRSRRRRSSGTATSCSTLWRYAQLTSPRLACQLGLLALLARPLQAEALLILPVLRWLLDLATLLWPAWSLGRSVWTVRWGLYRLQQCLLLGLVGFLAASHLAPDESSFEWGLGLALGLVTNQSQPPATASGRILEDGTYELRLCGDFLIRYQPVDEFDRRMFLLFLRQIRVAAGPPKQPFLRQEWLAEWFGTFQELISRWQSYQRKGDWRRLMSRQPGVPFSLDEQKPILKLWAHNFCWTAGKVAEELTAQGVKVSASAVEAVAKESGFWWARQMLLERYGPGPTGVQPKDGWLVDRLFKLETELSGKLETAGCMGLEERIEVLALSAQMAGPSSRGVGEIASAPTTAPPGDPERGLPPLYTLQRMLFGSWEDVVDGQVRCPYCQSTRVARKSRQGRPKRFYDAAGQIWVIEVQRYYCKNRQCHYGSFTDLPPGLLPYSRWSQLWHWSALDHYASARSTYRLVARRLGVSTATTYRWVAAVGRELLPIGTLFGLVRSSGVVGIDEKWVKVPKNDKPEGKHRKWMYVHLAVDVYTYDLLHIAIFPHENGDSARAFLLELKVKGYRPSVIVTDLRTDYGSVIAAVFPKAEHHECVFHALQAWGKYLRDAYGSDYRQKMPEAAKLADLLKNIFQAKTKRTAYKDYQEVLALREAYVAKTPKVASVFDSLERHFPKLVNAIESQRIPLTNNAVELVIRRFEQHYRWFCGFDSIEAAQSYLAVFELVYRFSPFSADARPAIRGKCPLELAGYDVANLPITQAWRGYPPHQPSKQPGQQEVVPSA